LERPFTQREWHHIQFRDLPATGAVADRDFYRTFYAALLQEQAGPSPDWIAQKQRMGRWLAARLRTGGGSSRRRALSIGAGLGFAEAEVARDGHEVDILECEAGSLRFAAAHSPRLRPLVADARALPLLPAAYDAAWIAGVDYVFPRDEYIGVLREARRVIRPDGTAVVICFSNLSARDMVRALVRPGTPVPGASGAVAWGFQRSVGAHVAAARRAGLRVDRIEGLTSDFEPQWVRQGTSWLLAAPRWSASAVVAVTLRH
jgi:SAM-dependent methyltransferase